MLTIESFWEPCSLRWRLLSLSLCGKMSHIFTQQQRGETKNVNVVLDQTDKEDCLKFPFKSHTLFLYNRYHSAVFFSSSSPDLSDYCWVLIRPQRKPRKCKHHVISCQTESCMHQSNKKRSLSSRDPGKKALGNFGPPTQKNNVTSDSFKRTWRD